MKEQGKMEELDVKLQKLTKKVAMLEQILDALPQPIFVKDEERRYIYGNRAFREKLSLSEDEVLGADDAALFPNIDCSQQETSDRRILSGKKDKLSYINRFGAPHEVLLTQKYAIIDAGKICGLIGIITDNSQNAIIETENRMAKDIIGHSELLLLRVSAREDYPVIYASQQIERFGYSEIIFKSGLVFFADILEGNELLKITQMFDENAEWGIESFAADFYLKGKNQKLIPLSCTVFIRRDESKKLQYFDLICFDRSVYENERRRLREYETRWELAITSAGNGVWDYDLSRQTIHISPNWVEKLGYDDSIISAKAEEYLNLIHPDDRPRVHQSFLSYIQNPAGEYTEEYRILSAAGDSLWVVDRGKITEKDKDGKPLRFIGMVSDITEYKLLTLKLKESNERYEALFRDAREPIIIENEKEEIFDLNQAACTFLGYSRDELLQMRTRDLQLKTSEKESDELYRQPRADYSKLITTTLSTKCGEKKEVEISISTLSRPEGSQFISIIHDVTKRSISEAELKRVHQIYQRGIENIQGVPYILDYRSMTYSYVSDRLLELVEIHPHEFTPGMLVSLVKRTELLPGTPFISTKEMGEAFRGGHTSAFHIDMELELPSGKRRWISDNAIPIMDEESGQIIGSHGILLNIDDRKRAEEQLKKSEATFRGLVSGIPDGITLVEDQKISFINENMCRLTGYSADELRKLSLTDIAHPDDLPAIKAVIRNAKETGHFPDNLEYRLIRKDGKIRYMQNRWGELDENFDSSARLVITTDISDRVMQEQEIKKLQLAIEQIPLSIVITNAEGIIEYVNPYFSELTGYSAEEAKGNNPRILNAGKLEPAFYKALWKSIAAGKDWEGEFINKKKDGTLYWESATICPIRDHRGNISHYVGIKVDITEEKLRQEEQSAMQDKLRHQKKLESIGVLAGGVAHEINNPLMGIINYAQLIQDRLEEPRMKVFTEGIIREGNRIAKIIRNLLAFARQREQEPFQPIMVSDIIDAALSLISTMMRHDQISIRLELDEALPPVFCQEQQIQQVLINLLTNARTALNQRYPGDSENKIIIIGAIPIEINAVPYVRIIVEDHGVGIPQDIIDKIFDPFFTTHERHEGAGLGLTISYNIIKEHKGQLEVESELGKYTRVFISLPRNPQKIEKEQIENEKSD
jgi:PAS domain S-box-containing protein